MGQPVVHFEIIGADPARLRGYYGQLFGWQFDVGDASTEQVSQPGQYGFISSAANGWDKTSGINGGVGGGAAHSPRVLFYVGVPSVEAALATAQRLGGRRLLGPEPAGADFSVGRFADPEGNVVGVAGPACAPAG